MRNFEKEPNIEQGSQEDIGEETRIEYLPKEKEQRETIIKEAEVWKDLKEYREKIAPKEGLDSLADFFDNYSSVLKERTPESVERFIGTYPSNFFILDLISDLKDRDEKFASQLADKFFEQNKSEDLFNRAKRERGGVKSLVRTMVVLSPENAEKVIKEYLPKIKKQVEELEDPDYSEKLRNDFILISELVTTLQDKDNTTAEKVFKLACKAENYHIAGQMAVILGNDEFIKKSLNEDKIHDSYISDIGVVLSEQNSKLTKEIIEQFYQKHDGLGITIPIAIAIAEKDPETARKVMQECQKEGKVPYYNNRAAKIALALGDKEALEQFIDRPYKMDKDLEEVGVMIAKVYPDIAEKIMLKFFEDAQKEDKYGFSAQSAGMLAVSLGYFKNADFAVDLSLAKKESYSTEHIKRARMVGESWGRIIVENLNASVVQNQLMSLEQKTNLLQKATELNDKEYIKSLGAVLSEKEVKKVISKGINPKEIEAFLEQGRLEYKEAQIEKEEQDKEYDIFETADLKTIIPETPEEQERIAEIKSRIIDIQKYEGLLHHTQLTNIQSILTKGFKPRVEVEKFKFGFSGKKGGYALDSGTGSNVWVTATRDDSSFLAWENIPFDDAGPITILFDTEELRKIDSKGYDKTVGQELLEFIEYSKTNRRLRAIEETIPREGGIPKEAQIGIIVSPDSFKIERRKTEDREEKLDAGITRTIKGQKEFHTINPIQAAEIASNRLTRIFKDPEAQLVPLYDNKGNVLWPEKISYEQVKKLVEKKNKEMGEEK